jgi:hypothetical protein
VGSRLHPGAYEQQTSAGRTRVDASAGGGDGVITTGEALSAEKKLGMVLTGSGWGAGRVSVQGAGCASGHPEPFPPPEAPRACQPTGRKDTPGNANIVLPANVTRR